MNVRELIEELLTANQNGSVMISIQTPMGWDNVDIESVKRYKWGVEIETEQTGEEYND